MDYTYTILILLLPFLSFLVLGQSELIFNSGNDVRECLELYIFLVKFQRFNITHVIIKKGAKLNMFLSRNDKYKQLYTDKNFVIYERTEVE